MARIAGVDIPPQKRVVISLTYIHGIGNTTAAKLVKTAGVEKLFGPLKRWLQDFF